MGKRTAIVTAGILFWTAAPAMAAPPSNDTCAGVQRIAIGESLEGSTAEASNDYAAATSPSGGTAPVPAAGPDVVYHLRLGENEAANVSVDPSFASSIYAAPTIESDPSTSAYCGTAYSVGPGNQSFSTSGPSLWLTGSGPEPIDWWIVVDGRAAGDKGAFNITVSRGWDLSTKDSVVSEAAGAVIRTVLSLVPRLAEISTQLDELAAKVDELAVAGDSYRSWFFTAGSTRKGYKQTLTLFAEQAANVSLTFFTTKAPKTKTVVLAAGVPNVVSVNKAAKNARAVSISVESDQPIRAERTLIYKKLAIDTSTGEHD